ncbi:MAG: hypothetical protein RLZZ161_398 [Bacteroidota bacterium]|jgi:hypothetical protein
MEAFFMQCTLTLQQQSALPRRGNPVRKVRATQGAVLPNRKAQHGQSGCDRKCHRNYTAPALSG